MTKKAFTLIELLVVIAIIAILAAILFPVFAQAKLAAKKAADLSNTKQLGLAANIYMTDVDDTMPVYFLPFPTVGCLPTAPTLCNYRVMWQDAMYPYMKNWQMLTAPSETSSADPVWNNFNLSYGYNYGYLSTLCVANDPLAEAAGCPATDPSGSSQWFQGINSSGVNRPANIVMFTDNGGKTLTAASVLGSMVNPPDAWPASKYFYGPVQVGWGLACQDYFSSAYGSGLYGDTDGFAPRYANGGNITFVDSHAKNEKTGAAAAGTNYNPTLSCTNVLVTDYSLYQWDPRYDTGTQK